MNEKFVKYKNIRFRDKVFVFKYDVCPITGDNLFHIFVRHALMPNQAIKAFLNASQTTYNETYKRYEAYSEVDNITVVYFYLSENKIFIISAYYED